MEKEKYIDESWKESAESEKEFLEQTKGSPTPKDKKVESLDEGDNSPIEVNFVNYITSLTFQALIFLGEIPNPVEDNKIEINLPQAKFLIDTLILLREKTKGNLDQAEENLLNASIYELQLKFVEQSQKKDKKIDQ